MQGNPVQHVPILSRAQQGMNVVATALARSIVEMTDVLLVCVMFFFIFGIVGMQLFMGKFYSCNDDTVLGRGECTGEYVNPGTGSLEPRLWGNARYNFDNIGSSLLSLFVTVTGDGYSQIVDSATSIQGIDVQPRHLGFKAGIVYFQGFIVFCSFCLIYLSVGVIFTRFNEVRDELSGRGFTTKAQHALADLTDLVFAMKPLQKYKRP